MRIANDCVVSIQYELTNQAGKLLDRSPEGQPLEYIHGAAGILPELERQLAGKAAGDSFDVSIPPDRGFGERQPRLIEVVPRSQFPDAEQLAVGKSVNRTDPNGGVQQFTITALDADTVTVDGNHALAGMTLRFRGSVVAVRAATAEELSDS